MANPNILMAETVREALGVSRMLDEIIRALPEDEFIDILEYIGRNYDIEFEDENAPTLEDCIEQTLRMDERITSHELWE